MKMRRCMAVLALVLSTGVARAQDEQSGQTVSGFRLPEYDEQNNLKSELIGEFAKVLPDGVIEITQLKIDFYNDGKVDMTVTAPKCTYKQQEGTAVSDSEVRIARDNMVVTGVGFAWSGHDERFEIFKNAKVVLKGARKGMDTGADK
jgi:hypothetical protein